MVDPGCGSAQSAATVQIDADEPSKQSWISFVCDIPFNAGDKRTCYMDAAVGVVAALPAGVVCAPDSSLQMYKFWGFLCPE